MAPKLTYIIDIHIFGNDAFPTTNSTGISLKTILENSKIPKVFFDIRNDSDALYSQYHICVDGIIDVQVLELATRNSSKDFVAGLARCIEKDSTASGVTKQIWQHTKESVSQLYDPRKGDRYDQSIIVGLDVDDMVILAHDITIVREFKIAIAKRWGGNGRPARNVGKKVAKA